MKQQHHDTPHISPKWRNTYLLVIGVLLLLIILFYLFTQHFQ